MTSVLTLSLTSLNPHFRKFRTIQRKLLRKKIVLQITKHLLNVDIKLGRVTLMSASNISRAYLLEIRSDEYIDGRIILFLDIP